MKRPRDTRAAIWAAEARPPMGSPSPGLPHFRQRMGMPQSGTLDPIYEGNLSHWQEIRFSLGFRSPGARYRRGAR